MDGLTLLQEASAAGLTVLADGDRLAIRGPRSADAIARRLLAEKPAVMAALRGLAPMATAPGPHELALAGVCPGANPCPWCGRRKWWRSIYGVVVCGQCHPPVLPELIAEWLDGAETGQAH